MANIDPAPSWANIRRLETTDRNMAGPGGILNDPTTSIAARLNLLRDNDTTLGNSVADVNARQDATDTAIANIQGQVLNAPGTLSDLENGAALDPVAGFPDVPSVENSLGPVDAINEALSSLSSRSKYLSGRIEGANAASILPYTANIDGAIGQTVGSVLDGSFVTPETFGNAGAGMDDAPFFIAAIASGRKVRLSPGKTYRINSPVLLTSNKDVHFDGSGAVVLQNGNSKVFDLINSASGLVTASVSDAIVDFSIGASAITQCSAITAPGHNLAIGDIGRIFSDDPVEGSDTTGQFCAEFFVVGAVSGSTIYTTGRLIETYSTGVKICKPSTAKISIHGLTVRRGSGNTAPTTAVSISGFLLPTLTGLDGAGLLHEFISVRGCLHSLISGSKAENLRNNTATGSYGYGINDCSSQGTQVVNFRSSYCRHAYTTTSASAIAGDDLWYLRGRTIDSMVFGGKAIGCAGAWDTHAPALRIVFEQCDSEADYRGDTSGGFAYQLRAKNCTINNCTARNSRIGASVIGGAAVGQSARLVNFQYSGPADHIPVVCTGQSASPVSLTVQGGVISTQAQYAVDLTNTVARCDGLSVQALSADSAAHVFSLREGATAYVNQGLCSAETALVAWAVHKDASASIFSSEVVARGFSNVPRIANLGTFNAVSQHLDWNTDATLSGVPFDGLGSNAQAAFSYRTQTNDRPLAFRTQVAAVSGNIALNLVNSGERTIIYRLEVSATGVTVNSIPKGAFRGQQMLLLNRDTSTQTFSLVSSTNVSIGTALTVSIGKGVGLTWDGNFWRASYP